MSQTLSHGVKHINELHLFCNGVFAGILKRTDQGCEIIFDTDFLNDNNHPSFSYKIPKQSTAYTYKGVNLPPFFAGLLPEGLRLKALVNALKTSEDDLFSLLAAHGEGVIGDIYTTTPMLNHPHISVPEAGNVDFYELFEESLNEGILPKEAAGFAGVQEKLSASMISFPMSITKKNTYYILKLNPKDKPNLVQNELQCLQLAQKCGIKTNSAQLIYDKNNNPGLLVERFDRTTTQNKKTFRIHQEDACQFLNRYPADKYRISYQEVCSGIQELATAPQIEILKAIQLYIFSYLIGNGDLHAKNISLQTDSQTQRIQLTPAYDLICTYLYKDQKMALKLDGRDSNIKRKHIINFGQRFDIPAKALHQSLDKMLGHITKNKDLLLRIPQLTDKDKKLLNSMLTRRTKELS